jgi:hypothetical protein
MIDSPVTLVDQSIDTSLYKPYPMSAMPGLVLGFVIKNKYDQERLRLKSILQPKNIIHHYYDDGELKPIYIHGIELAKKESVSHLCTVISNAQPISLHGYRNILKYNHLTCKDGSGYLQDGVYPIDIKCLPKLSTNRFKSHYLYLRSLLDTNDRLPWFSSWSDFNIFMLCPSTIQTHLHK